MNFVVKTILFMCLVMLIVATAYMPLDKESKTDQDDSSLCKHDRKKCNQSRKKLSLNEINVKFSLISEETYLMDSDADSGEDLDTDSDHNNLPSCRFERKICNKQKNGSSNEACQIDSKFCKSGCSLTKVVCNSKNTKKTEFHNLSSILNKNEVFSVEITNQEYTVIPDNPFRGLIIISLNLKNNEIEKLEAGSLKNIHGLRTLILSNNFLTNTIDFTELNDLITLDLDDNIINTISDELFANLTNLRILTLFYNNISFVHSNAFFHNQKLTVLDLSQNLLQKLSLTGLENLRCMNLSYNFIENLNIDMFLSNSTNLEVLIVEKNRIQDIDIGFFNKMSKLIELNLNNNNLFYLHENLFKCLNNLIELSLMNNKIIFIQKENFVGLASLEFLDFQSNILDSFNIENFIFLPKLKLLNLAGQNIYILHSPPISLEVTIVQELFLNNNNLQLLTNSSFIKLTSLKKLKLFSNYIHTIESNAFYDLTSLEYLDLKNNNLSHLNGQIFANLFKLKYLNLNKNKIYGLIFDISANINMEILQFDHNKIAFVKNYFLTNGKALRNLSLKSNQMSSIDRNSFVSLSELFNINLYDNCLFHLDPKLFINLTKLVELNLALNAFTSKSIMNAFQHLKSLKVLLLNRNRITNLQSGMFDQLVNLEKLDLERNLIYKIDLNTFANLQNLYEVNLNDIVGYQNGIKFSVGKGSISPNLRILMFKGNPTGSLNRLNVSALTSIDLSNCIISKEMVEKIPYNSIQHINLANVTLYGELSLGNYFNNSFELKNIDLSDNIIGYKEGFLSNSSKLETIALGNTNMSQSDFNFFNYFLNFENLRYLDLKKNKIYEFSAMNLHIVFLDISFNCLTAVKQDNFEENFELAYLNLSHNQIEYIEKFSFVDLEAIETLDLSYNKLESLDKKIFGLNKLVSLRKFYIQNNLLTEIDVNFNLLFDEIVISNNSLETIPNSILINVNSIMSFYLDFNELTEIKYNHFKMTNRILFIFLSNNKIDSIEDAAFSDLSILVSLDLSCNLIFTLSDYTFNGLLKLENLNLSFNRIEYISMQLFSPLKYLGNLDISQNLIKTVEPFSFQYLSNLRNLNICQNGSLKIFRNNTLIGLANIKFIFISPNIYVDEESINEIITNLYSRKIAKSKAGRTLYDPINVVYVPNRVKPFTERGCQLMWKAVNQKIIFGLNDDRSVLNFLTSCREYLNNEFFTKISTKN